MIRTLAVTVFALTAFSFDALCATTGFHSYQIVLYQPDSVLQSPIPSVKAAAAYEKGRERVCTDFFASTKTPEQLDIVVGMKPSKGVRVWFVSSTRSASA